MEKDRNYRTIAVIALIVAVAALSIGYAAFTTTLNISSGATITPVNNFSNLVQFKLKTDATGPAIVSGTTPVTGTVVGDVEDSAQKTWTGISVPFTEPGQSSEMFATVKNGSNYVAYLDQISLADSITLTDASTTEMDGNSYWTIERLKPLIQVTITVDDDDVLAVNGSSTSLVKACGLTTSIAAKQNSIEDTAIVKVKVEFLDHDDFATHPLDRAVTITIPDISLDWSTAQNTTAC